MELVVASRVFACRLRDPERVTASSENERIKSLHLPLGRSIMTGERKRGRRNKPSNDGRTV